MSLQSSLYNQANPSTEILPFILTNVGDANLVFSFKSMLLFFLCQTNFTTEQKKCYKSYENVQKKTLLKNFTQKTLLRKVIFQWNHLVRDSLEEHSQRRDSVSKKKRYNSLISCTNTSWNAKLIFSSRKRLHGQLPSNTWLTNQRQKSQLLSAAFFLKKRNVHCTWTVKRTHSKSGNVQEKPTWPCIFLIWYKHCTYPFWIHFFTYSLVEQKNRQNRLWSWRESKKVRKSAACQVKL